MECNKIDFDSLFSKIQVCHSYRENWVKIYFDFCYEDLLSRSVYEDDKGNPILTEDIFSVYMNLPLTIVNKIFKMFDETKKGYLIKNEFSDGMFLLYFGHLDSLEELTFKIFDLEKLGEIKYQNVLFILYHLQNNCEIVVDNIENIIINFFGDENNTIKLNEYIKLIRTSNSNIFILFLFLLYSNQPFSKDSLKFFKNNFDKNQTNFDDDYLNKSQDFISNPSKEISILFKYSTGQSIGKMKRKTASSNLLYKNKLNSVKQFYLLQKNPVHKISSKEIVLKQLAIGLEEKLNLLEILNNEKENKINLENSESNNETIVYKFSEENRMQKIKLVIIDKDMFSFKYSINHKKYIFEKVISLQGYFVDICDPIEIKGNLFYPITLLAKCGNTITNYSNIYFFQSQLEMKKCYNILKRNLNIREIEDYYEILEEIGVGRFGRVKLGLNKKSKEKVAIKIYTKKNMNEIEISSVTNEIDVMKFIKNNPNENIVKPIDLFEDNKCIYIVMEYLSGGTLEHFLKNENLLNDDKIILIIKQILNALNYLKKFGIIHRDIKLENILVENTNDESISITLVDFGLSKIISENETLNDGYGTLLYSAPEIILKKNYTRKIDIWSFGILAYYLVTGEFPFISNDESSEIIFDKICNNVLTFPENLFIKDEIKNLILKCLTKNPDERFNLEKLYL